MRTDIHTHAFHPKIAHKVLAQLQGHYGIAPVGTGTVDDLIARAKAAGIGRVAVHTAATDASQVIPANNWAMELMRAHPEVLAFGTLHPDFPASHDLDAEVERLWAAGIRGLKFHPDFQGFFLDDPRFADLLRAAAGRFVLMVHVGDRLPPEKNPSCPRKLARVVRDFPDTRIIAAHLGGYLHWDAAIEHLLGLPVWIDTSSSLPFLSDDKLRTIFSKHPFERILFGSDYPLFDPGEELKALERRLKLGPAGIESLLTNADRLFPA